MIFYFSGTGNSEFAAKELSQHINDSNIISITECVRANKYSFSLSENEKIGFVFPVFYDGLPTIVADFIKKLEIRTTPETFVWTVITAGAHMGGSAYALKMLLSSRWIFLSAAYSLTMPDNYIIMYNPCEKEHAKAKIKNAKVKLAEISQKINAEEKTEIESSLLGQTKYDIMQRAYNLMRSTKKFFADENCVGCGKCAAVCPIVCIEMKNGKPYWNEKKCVHCTACINRCPVNALQYGKKTKKRNRYNIEITF